MTNAPETTAGAVLIADRLSDCHPGHPDQPVFQDWSAAFHPGVTLIRGGDGSGKSTLLRLLAGTLAGTGRLEIGGISLSQQPDAYRQQVAWCEPGTESFDAMTGQAYFELLQRIHPSFDSTLALQHVEGFSLTLHWGKPLYQLSTGSKRKIWLAGSLASGAPVTLLDDPTAALDLPSIRYLMRTLEAFSHHPARAWIVTGYEAPAALPLQAMIDLPA